MPYRVYFTIKNVMKIAVVGAGFCGLACAYYATRRGYNVCLFDKTSIGAGASGISAGLLHCYSGPKAKLSWEGHAAMQDSIELLDVASQAHEAPVYTQSGIFRPQIAGMDYSQILQYPDVEQWEGGIFIRSGITVNCSAYLQGLWLACQGTCFEQRAVYHPSELSGFDKIIFTVGSGQNEVKGVDHPPVSLIKGQTLELEWPFDTPIPYAINAGVQFAQIAPKSVWAGATYERSWQTLGPDPKAEDEIRKKIALFSTSYAALPLKAMYAGFRAATGNKLPFITATSPNIYTIGGMGSKGLLYHAFMAKKLFT